MSDRGFLFLFSILMIIAGVASAGWLVASGQAATVDGLFLVLTALLVALVFALYVKFVISRAMEAPAAKPSAQPAKTGTAAPAAKPAPTAVAQQQ